MEVLPRSPLLSPGGFINTLATDPYMKHGDTKCKICGKSFPNIKDALMHTANEHSQEIINDISKKNLSGNGDMQELHIDN